MITTNASSRARSRSAAAGPRPARGAGTPRCQGSAVLPVMLFIGTVVAANALTARYGLIPVGLGLTATAGTAAAGLTLLTRDWVHRVTGRPIVLACIAAGAAASATGAGARLAAASGTAFILSELTDLLIYQRLYRRGWILAALGSNTIAAPIDSILFLAMAGFPIWAPLPGQLWVKAIATVVPLSLVTATRALLRHRLRSPRP